MKGFKLMIKSKISLILLSWLFFVSCSNTTDIEPVGADYKISDVSKEFLLFEKGSRWIYQDDSTAEQSQVQIFSNMSEIRQAMGTGTSPSYTYEAVWMLYSASNSPLQKGEVFASNFDVLEGIPNAAERVYFKDGHYKIAFAPYYPFETPVILGGEEGVFINKELIPSMVLNGKEYQEVYHSISEDYRQAEPDTVYYHFYFARHYGLIKYQIVKKTETTSVSLVESNLIQNP